jgi:hypothetical protein
MGTSESESPQSVEDRVGHPGDKWDELRDGVQALVTRSFADVQDQWLDLMWTLDAFRTARVLPRGYGDSGALNRKKGDWFADLVALLLHNRTSHQIGARTRVPGFSQRHQIDVAWPARGLDPLVCCETKVTGAPAFGKTPARPTRVDFVNRRKELKFAATDLKLFRRQQETRIAHWDEWRGSQPPRAYFLWGARLEPGADRIETVVREARALIDTYLDGVGLVAWRSRDDGPGYEAIPVPEGERVTELDDVLYRMESFIHSSVDEHGNPPPPIRPDKSSFDEDLTEESD